VKGVADTGDRVTITGENFGADPSDISVSFNGTPAEFELVDESTIVATTPADYKTGNVTVTIHGYTMTGSAMFNPNSKGDVTVLYLQNYKAADLPRQMTKIGRTVNGGLRQYGIRIRHLSMQKTILLLPECSIKQQRASH